MSRNVRRKLHHSESTFGFRLIPDPNSREEIPRAAQTRFPSILIVDVEAGTLEGRIPFLHRIPSDLDLAREKRPALRFTAFQTFV